MRSRTGTHQHGHLHIRLHHHITVPIDQLDHLQWLRTTIEYCGRCKFDVRSCRQHSLMRDILCRCRFSVYSTQPHTAHRRTTCIWTTKLAQHDKSADAPTSHGRIGSHFSFAPTQILNILYFIHWLCAELYRAPHNGTMCSTFVFTISSEWCEWNEVKWSLAAEKCILVFLEYIHMLLASKVIIVKLKHIM